MAYAVLNAARTLRYVIEGVLCSKIDGGEWAIARGEDRRLIAPAVAEQRGAPPSAASIEQATWVRHVAGQVRAAILREASSGSNR